MIENAETLLSVAESRTIDFVTGNCLFSVGLLLLALFALWILFSYQSEHKGKKK